MTYRHYATLYFIVISTSTESPLALLDFIQVFVEALDRLFENVCELDLIFNFETLHAVLGEMLVRCNAKDSMRRADGMCVRVGRRYSH